jgi:hypothetical protein
VYQSLRFVVSRLWLMPYTELYEVPRAYMENPYGTPRWRQSPYDKDTVHMLQLWS